MKQKITKKLIAVSATLAAILAAGGFLAAQFGFFSGGTNAPSVPEDTMTRGLVGYWSFDEGSGSTAYDASGNGNDGTLIHDPKWTQGKSGSALQFDGTDDYVDCGNDESLNITDAITIEAWIKPTTWASYRYPVSKKKDTTGYSLQTGDVSTSGLQFRIYIGGAAYLAETNILPPLNQYSHIIGTYDGSRVRIYMNGIEQTIGRDVIGSIDITTNPLTIGCYSSGTCHFNGIIDEVRIYNRALSAEEVRYHYNHGGPVASWNFDEGSGTVVHDSSENGFDGVLHE